MYDTQGSKFHLQPFPRKAVLCEDQEGTSRFITRRGHIVKGSKKPQCFSFSVIFVDTDFSKSVIFPWKSIIYNI